MLTFFVRGKPEPAGSKTAYPLTHRTTKEPIRKNGRIITVVTDANPRAKAWQAVVRKAAREAMKAGWIPVFETQGLAVTMQFFLRRPKGQHRTNGQPHAWAPTSHIVKPDVLKLARAVEDALTGVVWRDDAQIVEEHLSKVYAVNQTDEGVMIEVEPYSAG